MSTSRGQWKELIPRLQELLGVRPEQLARPLRSVLYVPCSNKRALSKCTTVGSDGVILDLEDAVGPDEKEAARTNLAAFLEEQRATATATATASGSGSTSTSGSAPGRRPVLVVRVNGAESGHGWHAADVACVRQWGGVVDGVAVPKAEDAACVDRVAQATGLGVWAMVETARGVEQCSAIAQAEACSVLVAGTADLTRSLRCVVAPDDPARTPLLPHLARIVLAARAHGRRVLDGVHLDVRDKAGLLHTHTRQGRALGFDGKTLIHPAHVPVANALFAPDAERLREAVAVAAAYTAARAAGKGIVVCNGSLVENLHAAEALDTLHAAALLGLDPDDPAAQ